MSDSRPVPWAAATAALVVALYCRVAMLPERLGADGVLFSGPDDYYHARRVTFAVEHAPRLISGDTGLAAVEPPMLCPWPPLYDGALTAFGLLFRPWLGGNRYALEVLISLLPVLFGVLTVAAVGLLAWRTLSRRGAVVAMFAMACMPVHINMTMFGALDHHSVEALVVVSLLLLEHGPKSRRRQVAVGVLAGACVGLAQVIWLYAMLYALYLTYREWRGSSALVESAAMVTTAAAVGFVQLALGYPAISYETASLLQPLLLAAPLLFAIACRASASFTSHRPLRAIVAALATAATYGLLCAAEPVFQAITAGIGFARRGDVVALIAESRPIVETPALPLGYLGYGIYLWPLLLLAALWQGRQRPSGAAVLGAILAIALSLLTWQQLRFATALSPLVVWVMASWIDRALTWVRLPSWGAVAAVALFVVGSYFPYLKGLTVDLVWAPRASAVEQETLHRWLRQATPAVGRAADPSRAPAYRVMANWAAGHALLYRAERAVVANPYIFDPDSPGFADSIRFFYVWSEDEAYSYAQRARVRYVVVAPELTVAADELAALGLPVAEYVHVDGQGTTLRKQLTRSVLFRHGFLRPDPTGLIPGPSHFALRYETRLARSELGDRDSATKIYELVPGAIVTGRVGPNDPVLIQLELVTTAGRRLQLGWRTTATRAGQFSLRLPYETSGSVHAGTVPDPSGYQLRRSQGLPLRFHVNRSTVERGGTVRLQ